MKKQIVYYTKESNFNFDHWHLFLKPMNYSAMTSNAEEDYPIHNMDPNMNRITGAYDDDSLKQKIIILE